MTEWEPIGKVWVDSGQILLADPCYALTDEEYKHFFVDSVLPRPTELKRGVVSSGWGGDGHFPVFVKKDENGLVLEIKIILDRNNPLYGVDTPTKVYNKDEEVKHD